MARQPYHARLTHVPIRRFDASLADKSYSDGLAAGVYSHLMLNARRCCSVDLFENIYWAGLGPGRLVGGLVARQGPVEIDRRHRHFVHWGKCRCASLGNQDGLTQPPELRT